MNREKKPLREIVEEQRPDIALAAAFYSPAKWAPVCPVKADGDVLWSSPTDHYWALAWDTGPDVSEALVPPGGSCGRANYVANCLLVREGRPQPELYYNADVGGRRGRVAVGLTDTEWITYGAADGSGGACTPEQLRDCMAGLGCRVRRHDGRRGKGERVRGGSGGADGGEGSQPDADPAVAEYG